MTVINGIKDRRVIPNWRNFRRTVQLGELSTSNSINQTFKPNINRALDDWRRIKNIGTAADLINSAFVSGISEGAEIDDAINFIKSKPGKSSNILLDLISLLKEPINSNRNKSLLEIKIDGIEEFSDFINNQTFHRIIHKTKVRSKNELGNPIIWVDLARLYTIRGHYNKAKNAILISLSLAPNNRFVLRASTRFFIHIGQLDRALFYLKKAENIKNDPWLISAHIATSSIMERFSTFIKNGKQLVESGNFSDFDLTELTSSIGTLEHSNGSFKKAKSYFKRSMMDPNDNSLAQLKWISKDDERLVMDYSHFQNVINPFEASAIKLFEEGQWKEALDNSIKWLIDMPYSKRPAWLASYIAASLLNDKKSAIIICQFGLQANPRDPTLLNNIVYSIVTSGDDSMLGEYLNRIKELDLNLLTSENKITLQATLGLIALRNKENDVGVNLYKNAIQSAIKIKNNYLENLVIVNFTKTLLDYDLPEKDEYIKQVRNMKIMSDQKDLEMLKDEIIKRSGE